MERRRFSREFKLEAVRLVWECGRQGSPWGKSNAEDRVVATVSETLSEAVWLITI